jgi:hypothetical protein
MGIGPHPVGADEGGSDVVRCLHRLRELAQYTDLHQVHRVVDICPTQGCQGVRALARSLNIEMHARV